MEAPSYVSRDVVPDWCFGVGLLNYLGPVVTYLGHCLRAKNLIANDSFRQYCKPEIAYFMCIKKHEVLIHRVAEFYFYPPPLILVDEFLWNRDSQLVICSNGTV